MVKYLRLEEDGETGHGSHWGQGTEMDRHTIQANGLVIVEDLSLEPTSGVLTPDDVGMIELNDDPEEKPATSGFCYWYAKFVARFPVLFCILLLLLTGGGGGAVFGLYSFPSFSDPEKGFEARETVISDRMAGFRAFRSNTNNDTFHLASNSDVFKRSVDDNTVSTSNMTSSNMTGDVNTTSAWNSDYESLYVPPEDYPPQPCISSDSFSNKFRIVFSHGDRLDLFTSETLRSMCYLYDEYVIKNDSTLPSYYRDCEPVSVGQYAAFLGGKSSCHNIDKDDVTNLKLLLRQCASYYVNGSLKQDCTSITCPEVPENCTQMDAVYNIFHYLLPSESARRISAGEFRLGYTLMITPIHEYDDVVERIYEDNIQGRIISDGVTRIHAVGGGFKFDIFPDFLLFDFKFVGLGVALILLIVWVYTGSLFITLMTILDMGMSLMLSYFFYTVVFGLPFFPFVNILAVVLVIGIGADDAFVYVDIWKKMKEKHGASDENRALVLQETLHHAAITMFVTSFTTSSALFANVVSYITAIRCFAVYAGCAIIINFVYTVTWLPAVVIIEDKYLRCRWCTELIQSLQVFARIGSLYGTLAGWIRAFCEKCIPKIVFKLRYIWLILFTALGVGGGYAIFVTPKLSLPTQSVFQVFVSSDYLEQYDQVFRNFFDFEKVENAPMPIYFIWGVVSTDNGNPWDPDDGNPWDRDDRVSLVLDETFDVSAPASQEWLLQFCRDIRNQTFYSESGQYYDFCFMDDFKLMMDGPCDRLGFDLSPCCNQSTFPYEPSLFDQCAVRYFSYEHDGSARFGTDNKMTGLALSFTSSTGDSVIYDVMDEFWSTINEWTEDRMKSAPPGLAGGWFISYFNDQLFFFDLQKNLATGTPFSIALSLAVAAVVLLLTTRNFLITIYAMLSIAGAVFVTIGILVLIGWQLNIFESTVMSLAVGLSVDFTIHLGVAYRMAPKKDRLSRSTFALEKLICAITTAALSTFVAGAVMLPATVLSYQQLGVILSIVMVVSWAYASFFFMSLCYVIGPQGNCTQIPLPRCGTKCKDQSSCCCCCRQDNPELVPPPINDFTLENVAAY